MPISKAKTIHEETYRILLECLKSARRSANLTQAELAERLGADQSYVSKYERAERRLDIIEVRDVCHAQGFDFQAFVRDFESALSGRAKGGNP